MGTEPNKPKPGPSIALLQDLARILTPNSLSRLLVFAEQIDWDEQIASDYQTARERKWQAYFDKASTAFADVVSNFKRNPEIAQETIYKDLERYLSALELTPCDDGIMLLREIRADQFQEHCESCDVCAKIQTFLGWQPLFQTLAIEVELLEGHQSDLLRENRSLSMEEEATNLIHAIFGPEPELPLAPRRYPCY